MWRNKRALLALGVLSLLLPTPSWAAIAFVSVTDATPVNSTNTITKSVVVPSGTDRIMVVCIQTKDVSADTPSSGVTFNTSEAMTHIHRDIRAATFLSADLWYLVNPTVTTANVVVTFPNGNNTHEMAFSAVLLTGVDQTTPIDAQNGSNGSSSTLSTIVTTVAANAWIVDCAHGLDCAGLTVGAGQTQRTNRILSSTATHTGAGVSTVDGKASPGAETMDWTQVGASWAISSASFMPSGGGAGTCKQTMLMMGVGC